VVSLVLRDGHTLLPDRDAPYDRATTTPVVPSRVRAEVGCRLRAVHRAGRLVSRPLSTPTPDRAGRPADPDAAGCRSPARCSPRSSPLSPLSRQGPGGHGRVRASGGG